MSYHTGLVGEGGGGFRDHAQFKHITFWRLQNPFFGLFRGTKFDQVGRGLYLLFCVIQGLVKDPISGGQMYTNKKSYTLFLCVLLFGLRLRLIESNQILYFKRIYRFPMSPLNYLSDYESARYFTFSSKLS